MEKIDYSSGDQSRSKISRLAVAALIASTLPAVQLTVAVLLMTANGRLAGFLAISSLGVAFFGLVAGIITCSKGESLWGSVAILAALGFYLYFFILPL